MAATGLDGRRQWVLSALERYEVPLARFATRLLGDQDAACDAVQHTFLRLCDQSEEQLHDRLAAWLFTVCRNRALDMLRTRARTAPLSKAKNRATVAREPDPAGLAEKQELCQRLNRLVDELPARQREALGLWAEGFAYREIAEITGCTEGNVRVVVHRAIKQLRTRPLVQQLLDGTAPARLQAQAAPVDRR